MSEKIDLDALIDRLREASTGVFNNTATADFLMNAASDALESTLAELRQERERADGFEEQCGNQAHNLHVTLAALSRAEEAIERLRSARTGPDIDAALTEYDKQKERTA